MSGFAGNDSLLEMFLFETSQNLEQLEQIILITEEAGGFSEESVQEIFRIMHTIKGSAAMMSFEDISKLAHRMEDLFFIIRENPAVSYSSSEISDLVLACMDCLHRELQGIRAGETAGSDDCRRMIERVELLHASMKSQADGASAPKDASQTPAAPSNAQQQGAKSSSDYQFEVKLSFEPDCGMENIRAFSVVQELAPLCSTLTHDPSALLESDTASEQIREKGFTLHATTHLNRDELLKHLNQTALLKDLEVKEKAAAKEVVKETQNQAKATQKADISVDEYRFQPQSMISVNVAKLDSLMDLMGEAIIAETMVTESPDLPKTPMPDFRKATARLKRIMLEMQDTVMSLRLVPLSGTFQRMHRIVRDMGRKLDKQIELKVSGEETEVDKNIIEHLSDPLIHMIRNSIDHGIESKEERAQAGKPPHGTIRIDAQSAGGDVIITVSDDGRGLNREKILKKARQSGLVNRPEEDMSDREVYNMIFLPGFSTRENVTEFSGRGVGMDVVVQNLVSVGGTVAVDSQPGQGMITTIKIPLTIAIIDGMNVAVGDAKYTIPTSAIRETFRPTKDQIFTDTEGNEMVWLRGECLSAHRMYQLWGIPTKVTELTDGILVLIEQDGKRRCFLVDALLGRQQVVVKRLPAYVKRGNRLAHAAGCTLLGDGSISLILDVPWLAGAEI